MDALRRRNTLLTIVSVEPVSMEWKKQLYEDDVDFATTWEVYKET